MLADKDIDAALELIDAWNEGTWMRGAVCRERPICRQKDGFSDEHHPSISNPNFHELLPEDA
jgi:hypothetical protein